MKPKYELLDKRIISATRMHHPEYALTITATKRRVFRGPYSETFVVNGNGITFVYAANGRQVPCHLDDFCHEVYGQIMNERKHEERRRG